MSEVVLEWEVTVPRSKEKRFRNGIQACRLAAGYSSTGELSDVIGISKYTIDSWEQGRSFPRPEQVVELVNVLGCSADELYGLTAPEMRYGTIGEAARCSDLKYLGRVYESAGITGDRELLMAYARVLAGDYEHLTAEELLQIAARTNAALGVVLRRRRIAPGGDGSNPEVPRREGKRAAEG